MILHVLELWMTIDIWLTILYLFSNYFRLISLCLTLFLSVYICLTLSVCLSFCHVSVCLFVFLCLSPSVFLSLPLPVFWCFARHYLNNGLPYIFVLLVEERFISRSQYYLHTFRSFTASFFAPFACVFFSSILCTIVLTYIYTFLFFFQKVKYFQGISQWLNVIMSVYQTLAMENSDTTETEMQSGKNSNMRISVVQW